MNKPQLLKQCLLMCLCNYFLLKTVYAQTGSFTATFTSADVRVKPVTVNFSKPVFKFDNPHGYWFINPHNGYKHFNTKPDQGYADRHEELNGIAFINFNQTENDFDVYEFNDSISLSLQKEKFVISPPKYDPQIGERNKPLHVHINSITPSEISFTLSGAAALSRTEGYDKAVPGNITATGHFFREPQYAKSDVLPGCNCDPTIYAAVLDDDNMVRTASACEKALNNKLFDAVQKSMSPLFTNVDRTNNINITITAGCVDINVPVKDRPYCSSDYYHNGLTGLYAQKKIFSNDDRFGLRFIRTVSDAALGLNNDATANKKIQAAKMDSLYKLMLAKKITMDEYGKALTASMTNLNGNAPDIKRLEAENNLYITIIINATNKTQTDLKLADKNKTVVTHSINGAAFEIFSPLVKDGDGDWISSKEGIYFGKFSPPLSGNNGPGFDVKTTTTSYPANANKLTVYNIIIKMEGGKDLIDKAIANIDFKTLQDLITKQ
jgi:hypothetical protein